MYHAGKSFEQMTDLEDRGGKKTINLFTSPDSNCFNLFDITSICLPIRQSDTSVGANKRTKVRKSFLLFSKTCVSNRLLSFISDNK